MRDKTMTHQFTSKQESPTKFNYPFNGNVNTAFGEKEKMPAEREREILKSNTKGKEFMLIFKWISGLSVI